MAAQHTPEPWTVRGHLDGLEVVNLQSSSPNACDGVRTICRVQCGDYEVPDYDEAEVNARLLRAAPALLRVLKDLREQLRLSRFRPDVKKDYHLLVADAAAGTVIHEVEQGA